MPNSKSHDRLARESQPRTSIRVGWFSTWNSRCGIAEYSKNLLNGFDTERFNWTVLASQNDLLVVPDNGRVIRCWTNSAGSAGHLLAILLREPFDVLVIQFKLQADFGFLSLLHLEAVIACCHCAGTRVFLILHATDGLAPGGETMSLPRIAQSLSTVERILVHSYTDLERLRACGVQDNIELFPHGFIDLAPYDTKELRQAQQLPENAIIIGSHGFLLPHKGIDELIKALALLRDSGTRAKLLLANAVYPIPASEEQLALCRSIAADYQVTDDIIFETRFLPAEDSLKLLAACDVIVYPYQHSVESASGAVRLGLASRRPVMCSPLPIFSDVSEIVYFLHGPRAKDICTDLQNFLSDGRQRERLHQRQAEWVEQRSWHRLARRLMDNFETPVTETVTSIRSKWIERYILNVQADADAAKKRFIELESTARAQLAAAENKSAEAERLFSARLLEVERSRLHWQAGMEVAAPSKSDTERRLEQAESVFAERLAELQARAEAADASKVEAERRLAQAEALFAARLAELQAQAEVADSGKAEAERRLAQAEGRFAGRFAELQAQAKDAAASKAEAEQLYLHWKYQAAASAELVRALHDSTSWKVTEPLRRLSTSSRHLHHPLASLVNATRRHLKRHSKQPVELSEQVGPPLKITASSEPDCPSSELSPSSADNTMYLDLSPCERAIYLDLRHATAQRNLG